MEEQREQKNVRPDMTILPEDSALYQKEEPRTTRQRMEGMNRKQKAGYLLEYYGRNTLIAVAVIAFVVFLVLQAIFQKDTVLSVIAVNTTNTETSPAEEDEFYASVLKSCGFDLDDVTVSISSDFGVSPDAEDSASQTNIQTIQTRFMAGAVDVLFADEEFFYSLAEFDYLADLHDYLSDDVLEKYEDDFMYITSIDTGDTYLVGIRLHDNAWIESTGWYEDDVYIGISSAPENPEVAQALLLEVLGEN